MDETMHAYLDAKIQYETLSADRTLQVEDEVLSSFYHSFLALPCMTVEADPNAPVTVADAALLLSSMSLDEARALRDGSATGFQVTMDVKKAEPSENDRTLLVSPEDAALTDCYEITLTKTLSDNSKVLSSSSAVYQLRLRRPFSSPSSLRPYPKDTGEAIMPLPSIMPGARNRPSPSFPTVPKTARKS